jgi:hypothetical protein
MARRDMFRSIPEELVYRDGNGNTLWRKWNHTTNRVQWFAKNRKGELVTEDDVRKLLRESGADTRLV